MVGTTLLLVDGKLVIHKHSEFPPRIPAVQRVPGPGVKNSIPSGGSGSCNRLAGPGTRAPEGAVQVLLDLPFNPLPPQRQSLWLILNRSRTSPMLEYV